MPVVDVPPRFRVVTETTHDGVADDRSIRLAPSHAFGDGSHETTRMCLQALAAFAPRKPFTLLDVGSGTGVLSIGAVKLGGAAIGVEIDEAANTVARDNARLNGMEITFGTTWPTRKPPEHGLFDVVVANILRDILLALAPDITSRLASPGTLILSGLVSTDVPAIIGRYGPLLGGGRPEIFERDVWRALVWRQSPMTP